MAVNQLSVTHIRTFTTRPPRSSEGLQSSYLHISEEEFQEMERLGDFAETVTKYGHRYGSPATLTREDLPTPSIVEVDHSGLAVLRRETKLPLVAIFVTVRNPSELAERIAARDGRVPQSRKDDWASSIGSARFYDYVLINGEFECFQDDALSILRSEIVKARGIFWLQDVLSQAERRRA